MFQFDKKTHSFKIGCCLTVRLKIIQRIIISGTRNWSRNFTLVILSKTYANYFKDLSKPWRFLFKIFHCGPSQ